MIKDISIENKKTTIFNIMFYAIVSILSLIAISLIVAIVLYKNIYQKNIISKLDAQSNIENIVIQKNNYENIFSFDGFIENNDTSSMMNILHQNRNIEYINSSVEFPAFLSIRKASVYVDMAFSKYLEDNTNIIDGRIYNNNANEVVIGYGLSEKYGIIKNSVVAIIVEDSSQNYIVTNLHVVGIANFENNYDKNNKAYLSLNKVADIIKKENYEDKEFTQKLTITVDDKENINSVYSYIKENIDTNLFSVGRNTIKENILTEETVNQSSKLIMLAFIIVSIFLVASIMRIVLFIIKN